MKRGSKLADFGQGFYTTTSCNQAENWAIKRARRFNKFNCYRNVKPIVIVLDTYDINFIKVEASGLTLDKLYM